MERFHAVSFWIEAGGQFAADCAGHNFFLRGRDCSLGVFAGEIGVHAVDVADAHAGIEEQCLFCADDEIGDDFFLLVRLIDGEQAGANAIDLKPFVRDVHAFQLAIGGAREIAAPLGFLIGLRSEQRDENACGKMHGTSWRKNISAKDTCYRPIWGARGKKKKALPKRLFHRRRHAARYLGCAACGCVCWKCCSCCCTMTSNFFFWSSFNALRTLLMVPSRMVWIFWILSSRDMELSCTTFMAWVC